MSLSAGSVTVNPDATYSGSGMALALMDGEVAAFNALWAGLEAILATIPGANYSAWHLQNIQALATKCEAQATALVAYLTANTVVHVGSDTGTIA